MATILPTAMVFIACHGGAANHFATFASELEKKGQKIEVYATGPALKVFETNDIKNLNLFSLEGKDASKVAEEIAKKCQKSATVITDVGHDFDVTLQEALQKLSPNVERIAYYDNPEAFVPGGYSETASKVMKLANKVLFANANLANSPIYQTPSDEVPLNQDQKIGLGYYSLEQAEKIKQRRQNSREEKREEFLKDHKLPSNAKIFVYAGGNNAAYFTQALPACFDFFQKLQAEDLSDIVFVLHQHPGAKKENQDVNLFDEWKEASKDLPNAPQLVVSDKTTDEVQVFADAMLYHQTSMGPQFVLAGIPVVQVGTEPYEDILVKNNLCLVVNDPKGLSNAISALKQNESEKSSEVVKKALGISPNWLETLERLI